MAESRAPRPPRSALLRAIGEALVELDPPLSVVAERVLGLDARIDLVARDERGGVVVVCVAAEGDDLARFTDALAQRAWLEPRLADWRQLAPGLGLDPGRGVRALLLAPRLDPRVLAAAQGLGGAPIEPAVYRARRTATGWAVELEPVGPAEPGPDAWAPALESVFRTGLEEDDLGEAGSEAPSGAF